MLKNDQQLVQDFLAGDDSAFESLLKKYLKPIYNFLCQMVQDSSVSDDLTQETFIKTWKNLKRFDQTKSFKTWIFTIAKNTAYDYFKKKKALPFSFFEDKNGRNKLENVAEENIFLEEILNQKDAAAEIERNLREIPEKYQLILTMHYKEDFTLLEIADILKVPYNTIKSSHQRALKALKGKFNHSNAST